MGNGKIFCRIEKKYTLTGDQRARFQKMISSYIRPDEYPSCTICNLYFDTPTFLMIRNSVDADNYKEKLRLRSYGVPKPSDKVFLELKKKYDGVVYKRREIMTLSEAQAYISGGSPPRDSQIFREIDYVIGTYEELAPAVWICYDREAFYAVNDPTVRITFDSDLLYRNKDVKLESGVYGKRILDPDKYIMEIKASGGMPLWLTSTLDACGIYGGSFSKYGAAYNLMLRDSTVDFTKILSNNCRSNNNELNIQSRC